MNISSGINLNQGLVRCYNLVNLVSNILCLNEHLLTKITAEFYVQFDSSILIFVLPVFCLSNVLIKFQALSINRL